ncbi:urease accessory protein UreF [Thalassomonas actiniarum]|uniref:Urease accessory protein UreF n=2 Tax=Thalassomonas actiniarum TaxID=485447 RepID=A0AAE9YYU7_9GAMM|nr:urease accessory protein UreF [Thalassomonas actiniarum]
MSMPMNSSGERGTAVAQAAMAPLQLNRLLQLCSANLPVGGFSFSQGLEYATEKNWVKDQASAHSWIALNLCQGITYTDLALLKRLYLAIDQQNMAQVIHWNQQLIACRESKELRLADVVMGKALMRLLAGLDDIELVGYQALIELPEISFVCAFALAAYLWDIDLASTLSGYCWTFIDNQVAAATKLIPLGQTQGQNLLFSLSREVAQAVSRADQLVDEDIGASLPGLAMASAWHESQYSRLFRS